MSAWSSTPIPDEVFQQINSNPKVRNAIAFANPQQDQHQQFLGHVALLYPHRYSVTKEQKQAAQEQLERDKQAAIARLNQSKTLLMVGMGATITTDSPDNIDNHRVRGEFKSRNGKFFFLEVSLNSTQLKLEMFCEHSIDRTAEEMAKRGGGLVCQNVYYNYGGLERRILGDYTKSNLLAVVNRNFNCKFTNMEIDNFTLRVEDYISVSP